MLITNQAAWEPENDIRDDNGGNKAGKTPAGTRVKRGGWGKDSHLSHGTVAFK